MTVVEFLIIVVLHWVADFVLQDERWANGKSKAMRPLLNHTSTYSILWVIPIFLLTYDILGTFAFVFITFFAHTLTDFITSRIVSAKFQVGHYGSPIPNLGAFTVIGFDQVLHYFQLVLTYKFLFT